MSLNAVLEIVLGVSTYVSDWRIGLFDALEDEIVGEDYARQPVTWDSATWDGTNSRCASTQDIMFVGMPSCECYGYLIANGPTADPFLVRYFVAPVTVNLGDSLRLLADEVFVATYVG